MCCVCAKCLAMHLCFELQTRDDELYVARNVACVLGIRSRCVNAREFLHAYEFMFRIKVSGELFMFLWNELHNHKLFGAFVFLQIRLKLTEISRMLARQSKLMQLRQFLSQSVSFNSFNVHDLYLHSQFL